MVPPDKVRIAMRRLMIVGCLRMGQAWLLAAAALGGLIFGEATADAASVVKIDVYPPNVQLETSRDRQALIVVATRDDGVTLDVTGEAKMALADAKLARIEQSTLYPAADGKTTLQVAYQTFKAEIPVTVTQATTDRPISFKLDVMPVFMRAGCNVGSCHGQKTGKDGFMLSLFGYDPDGDWNRLTHENSTRRINLALPRESLLLEKCDGTASHTGGKRFDRDSELYTAILRWLEAGVPADAATVAKPVALELYPPKAVLEGAKTTQRFIARAKYSDGTDRDVSSLVVFLTNNDNSAPMDAGGLVTAEARGEAFVMARFATFTVGSQVLVLPKDLKYTPPTEKPANYVDELVGAKLHKLRLEPSALCADDVFLRRVTIDITGRLPTEAEYAAFMADAAADKRAKLVDELLKRKEFSELWAMKWAELLMIKSSNQVSYKSAYLYNTWLTNQISKNVPLDQIVREMLSATGGTFKNPPTNFYQVENDTLKTAENVAQVFMGIRTQCSQCHNHPFDRWTMDDYYGFAAFFSQIGRKQGEDYRETIVFNSGGGDVRHPVGGRVMAPKFLGGATPDTAGKDRREVLAQWLVSTDNPYFAPNVANRIWDHFFGLGIVEPVDDVRVSNPASNPELLDALGKKLVEYKYDFKRLVRDICLSNTYQRSTARNESNKDDERNFAHSRVRRVRAEVALDCLAQVTDTKDKFQGLPLGARAVQIADGNTSTYFLTTFGRAPRNTVCAAEASTSPTLSQALHMLNGPTIEGKIQQGQLIQKMLKEGKTPDQVIDALYLRALARKPDDGERKAMQTIVAADKNPEVGLHDVFWALLNSREFVFNH
jgi:hypothetical protein